MNFPNILASTRNAIGFSFFGANRGDNAIATLKDMAQNNNRLNNIFNFRHHDVQVLSTGLNPAYPGFAVSVMSHGAGDCEGASCDCTLYTCECGSPSCRWAGSKPPTDFVGNPVGSTVVNIARIGVGQYTATILTPILGFEKAVVRNVGFIFSNLAIPGFATVTPVAPGPVGTNNIHYNIATTNAAGVPSDDVLTNSIISMRIFFAKNVA
jgi:hypothetical protein